MYHVLISEKIPTSKIVLETDTIHDFTAFPEVMIQKTIQDSQIPGIKIQEMFQNITAIVKSCLKTATIQNIVIMNGFLIDKEIVFGIQITIPVGILMTFLFLVS